MMMIVIITMMLIIIVILKLKRCLSQETSGACEAGRLGDSEHVYQRHVSGAVATGICTRMQATCMRSAPV